MSPSKLTFDKSKVERDWRINIVENLREEILKNLVSPSYQLMNIFVSEVKEIKK